MAALAAAWALWERGRRYRAEAQRDAARMAADLYRNRYEQAESNLEDAIRRREEVILGLKAEVAELEADVAQCAEPGVVLARLRRVLQASPPALPGAGLPPGRAT